MRTDNCDLQIPPGRNRLEFRYTGMSFASPGKCPFRVTACNNDEFITVSIIEDDASAREILVGRIRRAEGFRCLSDHGDAESALAALPQSRPGVVLTDINLPGLNGIECVRRLKPLLPETQFLMLTVY